MTDSGNRSARGPRRQGGPRRDTGSSRDGGYRRGGPRRDGGPGRGGPRRTDDRHEESQRGSRRFSSDPSRDVALSVIQAVRERDAYANLLLPSELRRSSLSGRDAAFATELTYGTLRAQGTYDAIIAECIDRDLDQVDPELLDVLRLGAHQLLGMRVPSHAAVSQTVDQARSVGGPAGSRFVNAVLRKITTHEVQDWLDMIDPDGAAPATGTSPEATPARASVASLAMRNSHPEWIVRAYRESLLLNQRSMDEITDLLQANNAAPRTSVVALPGLADVSELHDEGAQPGQYSPFTVVTQGALAQFPAIAEGRARVQDEGSQLVAWALAQAPVEQDAGQWLDLCAGPGGKSALLAALHRQSDFAGDDARFDAVEVSEHRAGLVRQGLAGLIRLDAPVHVHCADGREWGEDHPETYDRVLVDAPCTGLGSLRRRPESRWRRSASDLPALSALQRELLSAAIAATRSGGVIGYVTCSPHPAETETIVRDVTKKEPVTLINAADILQRLTNEEHGAEVWGKGPTVQLWPHIHGTDAMFLALLRKG